MVLMVPSMKDELQEWYPSIVQQSLVKYMFLPIVDESSLETMLEVLSYHSSINSVELYLEVKPVSHRSTSLANHETRKRSRQNDANIDANPRESNNNGWLEEEDSTDDKNEAAQRGSKMKNPDPSKGLSNSVSKQLFFSSSWLSEGELYVGMLFRDQEELEKAVKLYSGRRQRNYDVDDYLTLGGNIEFRCKYGSSQALIKAQPSLSLSELIKWVKKEFGYTVSGDNMWDAKTKAITAILGDLDKSFSVLPKFMAVLSSSNKMVMDWQYDPFPDPKEASFRSVFWAFQQSIKGFLHCAPVIMVDTVDLSSKYGGKLLIAACVDAEFQIFPLAFAIITNKSFPADSW
ncbi:uncharacterized protein LOC106423817 [Brassica napus]|uniref:uncharacterized protein LOC106423817 n=1 Tax=Brassica napus TaxID=3708 RepID=UPI0006AAB39D|nr:uncharacterized protein LOC106423817 [Brassica napus]